MTECRRQAQLTLDAWVTDWLTVTRGCFPTHLEHLVEEVAYSFGIGEQMTAGAIQLSVHGESLRIPERIYAAPTRVDHLPTRSAYMVDCLLSRSTDGRVRQQAAEKVLEEAFDFTPAYIVPLIGEYVVEIVELVYMSLSRCPIDSAAAREYGQFIKANEDLLRLIRQRSRSYWDAYYRERYPSYESYPGSLAVTLLAQWAQRQQLSTDGTSLTGR